MKKLMLMAAVILFGMVAVAADMPGLTAYANGHTWTYTLLDGNTAAITACFPEPNGKLTIPSGLDIEVWKDGALITHVPVSSVEDGCFANCTKLTSVQCPNTRNFLHIRVNAFSGCGNLTSIAMYEGLASIGDKAFAGCSKLTRINIPQSVRSIGSHAFLDCVNAGEAVYPKDLEMLGYNSLAGCVCITNMVVPFMGNIFGCFFRNEPVAGETSEGITNG